MYREFRNKSNLSIEEAAERLHVAPRTISKYESGEIKPRPDTAIAMSTAYNAPALTQMYCKRECAIGSRYCYEILNNVDLSPIAILTKYRQEEKEAHEALEHLAELMLNKTGNMNCTPEEINQIWRWSLEMLDLEHVIETLKMKLWDFIDVGLLIEEHNQKCIQKKYVDLSNTKLISA